MSTTLRRKLLAIVAAPMLMAAFSAAAPAPRVHASAADQITSKETYYSSASYSQVVGYGYWYCDGDFIMVSGYQTSYAKHKFIAPCP